ncbi:type IV pilin [Diaphorobacter sp. HDW4B]|uniref:type 4 pilus major pilin n=1 Tax=Diaphorobacter sp. HDW4B TaxID=2714925 RepID=UPI00140A9BA8|nr:type 4 pilus major pilin [Diaphorobacter sp. HDW4B]QIL69953.1 type IV pilin [Diaphorobacter sp. HDW4B]
MRIPKNGRKAGFTLVEILLVVGFIALAGIGIYTVYTKVQMSNAALTEGKNMDTIKAGVKNLFGGTRNYTDLNNTVINDARVTPDSMRAIPYKTADGAINNSFGGVVTVTPASLGGASDNAFSVRYENVPGAVCSKLITGAAATWDQIAAGTTNQVVKTFGTGQMNIQAVAQACSTDSGSGVAITFTSL